MRLDRTQAIQGYETANSKTAHNLGAMPLETKLFEKHHNAIIT